MSNEDRRTHHKTKPILQVNFPYASVSLEEFLHVPLSGVWAQVANEDTTTTHCNPARVGIRRSGKH